MGLTPGTRLGPYEITALIGAGGMGEVYRATDTTLKRTVAIKVLPDSLASDGDRLARFQREAEVLAALNHPNIAQIHGLEKNALVMEFLDGPTLADRIAFGPVPLDEALTIAKQIAEALESAHERSIVHRDLKPANVKIRPDGTVKVLDFGLARALDVSSPASSSGDTLANSPTITSPAMTGTGVILGTAAYMSPEQARGQIVDRRADVWAFGCVLFEMLTGRRAFDGSSVVDAIGAALHKDPEWQLLPTTTPPPVRATLERCLQKDPRQRARDLGDVRLALDGGFGAPIVESPRAPAASHARPWVAAIAVLATAAIVGTAGWLARRPPAAPARTPVRFQIPAPAGTEFGNFFSLSPDGRTLVFQALEVGRGQRYWVHSFETNIARMLPHVSPTTSSQIWSPDGRYFAFADAGELKRTHVSGGPLEVITVLPSSFGGGTWGPDGTILFGSGSGPLMRVAASGGVPVAVTALDVSRGETGHLNPWLLRDGRHFLYMRNSRVPGNSGIWVGSLDAAPDAQPATRLVATLQGAVVAPGSGAEPDYVLFMRDGSLVAQAFDNTRLSVVGEPTPIVERVGIGPATYAQAWVSSNGTLVYRRPDRPGGTPAYFDREGRERNVVPGINDAPALYPRLSPDGSRLAIFLAGDLWIYDLSGRPPVRLTSGGQGDSPLWTPDGRSVVYEPTGSVGLRLLPADGTGVMPTPVTPPGHYHPLAFSADGRFLISTMVSATATTGNSCTARSART